MQKVTALPLVTTLLAPGELGKAARVPCSRDADIRQTAEGEAFRRFMRAGLVISAGSITDKPLQYFEIGIEESFMARLVLNHLSESSYRQLVLASERRNVNVSELAVILLEIAVAELAEEEAAWQSSSSSETPRPPPLPPSKK
ncbi:hypothetical protein [Salinicola aestuarinus]|uniref:hypothetical protein n=1 Tax=Salinicola aestuarinus TaxID=1949082 RepID=UPI000DA2166D|nr:hypothetical protein [Salinicola aestuarinus]